MEADESHNPPSANWPSRKASGVIQSKSKAQEPGVLMSVGRRRGTPQSMQKVNSAFFSLCSLRALD